MSREVVYGRNPVRELIAAGRRRVHEVWALPELRDAPWLAPARPRPASRAELGRACGTSDHQGVVAFCDPYPYVEARDALAEGGVLVALDGAQDPRNLGAVARVCDAGGARGMVMTRRGSPGVTPAVCKTSAGAVEHILVSRVENLASFLHDAKGPARWVVGADSADGRDYREIPWSSDTIIVLGAEGAGLRPRVRSACDELVRIPMRGRVDSLNLSVAAGILVYEALRGI
ncbi:MAG: RNA methyltransferase [Actinomycetota bacterium]